MLTYIFIDYLVGGFNPSDKYESQLGPDYSQYMESHKNHVPNHQPVYHVYIYIYIYYHDNIILSYILNYINILDTIWL